ncbi:MAG: deoxyguanosinetriphosphate triphosphohydrolase [Hyphomicrobiales bacterium]|nr:deoxyguanosinetriphosphate triphosphohydrolase [Hyphomicrobiales bacterium]
MRGQVEHLVIKPAASRAVFACNPDASRGRLHPEAGCPLRTPYQRDRDRIVHSAAFRRLTYKTQVFIYHEGDHFRTRLTHSLEVAQIARTMARALGLDEDLAEAISLAHDLGHTPFGHAGEDALHDAMRDYAGFDHNAQSLRTVTKLEHRYAAFDGLNLSWETLEGLAKHNGPLTDADGAPVGRYGKVGLPHALRAYAAIHDLQLSTYASAEAQIAAIADDIAYNNHDIDDGLRAGLLKLDALRDIPLTKRLIAEVEARHRGISQDRLIYEVNRRLITAMVMDVLAETGRRLDRLRPQSSDDIRNAGFITATFSEEMFRAMGELRRFLFAKLYMHPKIARIMRDAQGIVRDVFAHYLSAPDELPEEWRRSLDATDPALRARHVCDFVAGMTDRFAIETHKRLFDETPKLR